METMRSVVAVYATHPQAEEAVRVGKKYHGEQRVGEVYNAGDRIGHLMVLGPLAGWTVVALGEGAVFGGVTAHGAVEVSAAKRLLERRSPLSLDEHRAAGAV